MNTTVENPVESKPKICVLITSRPFSQHHSGFYIRGEITKSVNYPNVYGLNCIFQITATVLHVIKVRF